MHNWLITFHSIAFLVSSTLTVGREGRVWGKTGEERGSLRCAGQFVLSFREYPGLLLMALILDDINKISFNY